MAEDMKNWVSKGIFCLEGMWTNNINDKKSVLPILELLKKSAGIKYIYHNCATKEEVNFFINKWKKKGVKNQYPILYLGFHGGADFFTIIHNSKSFYPISELAEILEGSCEDSVVFFASCETLGVDTRTIHKFLDKTEFSAALGYKVSVDWLKSTAFEILILNALQGDFFDNNGIRSIKKTIKNDCGSLNDELSFSMVINKNIIK